MSLQLILYVNICTVTYIDRVVLFVGKATLNHTSPRARVGVQFLGSSCNGEDLDLGITKATCFEPTLANILNRYFSSKLKALTCNFCFLPALQSVGNWVDGHIYPARAKQTWHASTLAWIGDEKSRKAAVASKDLLLWQYFAKSSPVLQGWLFFMHHWTCPASAKCYFVCYTSTSSCPGPNQACLRIRGPNGLSDYPLHHFETSHPPPSFQVIPLKIQFATKVPVR